MSMGCCNGNCNQGRDCPARCDDEDENVSNIIVDAAIAIVIAAVAITMSMVVISHFFNFP